MLLYIIRHGEPDYASDSLTGNGVRQAAALAERFSSHGLEEIYVSPLGRAVQTARPTCDRLGLPYRIEEWMSEDLFWNELSAVDGNGERQWSFGCQNTMLLGEENPDLNAWHTYPAFSSCKAAEKGYRRIADCSDAFLAGLGYKRDGRLYRTAAPNNRRIAAFCHHGVGTAWLSHLLSIPPNIFWSGFDIAHSSVTILEFKNNPDGQTAPQCVCLSDISHIYKNNLPINAVIGFQEGRRQDP